MSKIAVNEITDEVGTGAPTLPNGLGVSGDIDVSGKLTNGGVSGIEIDTSGRVTISNQPAFHAMAASTNNIVTGILPYSGVTFNTNNNYNPTTSIFTAPIAGVYQFHASCYTQLGDNANSASAEITVNGIRRQIGEVDEVGGNYGYDGINMSVVVYLSANDQVAVRHRAGGELHLNGNNNSFSGALIS